MNKMNKCYTSKTTRNKITVLLRVETLKISIGGTSRKVRFVSIEVDRGLNGLACCFPGPSGT